MAGILFAVAHFGIIVINKNYIMKCPNCDETLVMTERQGVEIDYCPKCRGVWLDKGKLDKIIEKSQAGLAGTHPANRNFDRFDDDDDDKFKELIQIKEEKEEEGSWETCLTSTDHQITSFSTFDSSSE